MYDSATDLLRNIDAAYGVADHLKMSLARWVTSVENRLAVPASDDQSDHQDADVEPENPPDSAQSWPQSIEPSVGPGGGEVVSGYGVGTSIDYVVSAGETVEMTTPSPQS
jgi:hypothetical protein